MTILNFKWSQKMGPGNGNRTCFPIFITILYCNSVGLLLHKIPAYNRHGIVSSVWCRDRITPGVPPGLATHHEDSVVDVDSIAMGHGRYHRVPVRLSVLTAVNCRGQTSPYTPVLLFVLISACLTFQSVGTDNWQNSLLLSVAGQTMIPYPLNVPGKESRGRSLHRSC